MNQQKPAQNQRKTEEGETALLVSVPEAGRLLGIGATLAWTLVHAGTLPSVKLGRRVLVSREILENLAQPTAHQTTQRGT